MCMAESDNGHAFVIPLSAPKSLVSCLIRQLGWPRIRHRSRRRRGSPAQPTCSQRRQLRRERRKPVQSVVSPIDHLSTAGSESLRTQATSTS